MVDKIAFAMKSRLAGFRLDGFNFIQGFNLASLLNYSELSGIILKTADEDQVLIGGFFLNCEDLFVEIFVDRFCGGLARAHGGDDGCRARDGVTACIHGVS